MVKILMLKMNDMMEMTATTTEDEECGKGVSDAEEDGGENDEDDKVDGEEGGEDVEEDGDVEDGDKGVEDGDKQM